MASFEVKREDARKFAALVCDSKHLRGYLPLSPAMSKEVNRKRIIEYFRVVADILEADQNEQIPQ